MKHSQALSGEKKLRFEQRILARLISEIVLVHEGVHQIGTTTECELCQKYLQLRSNLNRNSQILANERKDTVPFD